MDKPQLLEAINKLPDNIRFLSPKDDEANGYRWLSGVSVDYIHKEDLEEYEPEGVLSEDDVKDYYTDEEIEDVLVPVAVIW